MRESVVSLSDYRYNSRYDSKCRMEIQEAVEYILSYKYGDTIPVEKLAKILKINIENEKEYSRFKSQMCRIKNFLIEYGYIIKSIAGVGYYILKPQQISGYCYHTDIDKTLRTLEKSNYILENVDRHNMSDVRKKEHTEIKNLSNDVYHAVGKTINISEYKKNKYQYDNLID